MVPCQKEDFDMKRKLFISIVLIGVLALTAQAALAGNPFSDLTSTVGGYATSKRRRPWLYSVPFRIPCPSGVRTG